MIRHVLTVVTVVTALVSCTSSSSPLEGSNSSAQVTPLEGVGFAAFAAAPTDIRDGEAETGVISILAANHSDSPLRITKVVPQAEAGLEVKYIGYASCLRGCVGSGGLDEPSNAELVRTGRDGLYPVPLKTRKMLDKEGRSGSSLIFTLRAVGEGVEALQQGCLYLKGAVVTLAGGRRVWMTFDDGAAIGAIKLPHGRPCDSHAVSTPTPPGT